MPGPLAMKSTLFLSYLKIDKLFSFCYKAHPKSRHFRLLRTEGVSRWMLARISSMVYGGERRWSRFVDLARKPRRSRRPIRCT